jgi:RNA 3'-terminal phosphate cyclase
MIHTDGAPAGFSALGAPGKPAERVAKEAFDRFEAFYRTSTPCDPFIADQIVSYLALAEGDSSIHFSRLTLHLLTQVSLLARFLPGAELILKEKEGEPGMLHVRGIGWKTPARS